MSDEAPDGYRYDWITAHDWITPPDGRKCSKAGCLHSAIALLRRRHGRFLSGFALWGYCADHLYGLGTIRKIEDGVVKDRICVPLEKSA
jgi:hypothetical protein